MSCRALMWVQSRLGIGHLSRALSLCGALADDGMMVTLAHGGPPSAALIVPEGVTVEQLPIANAPDLSSSRIQDSNGHDVDDAWRYRRIGALKELISRVAPDIFLTETFPLGRWLFAFELMPILDWLHTLPNRPMIVASVRDVLTRPSKDAKASAMIALAQSRYDLILCHGDERILSLPESFGETHALKGMTRYSGYVTSKSKSVADKRSGVLVVAGGGAVGETLFHVALEARRIWSRDRSDWTLVAGPRIDSKTLVRLKREAPSGFAVEGAVANLADRYGSAELVVAQGGYNTVCEAFNNGARLTVVPYTTDKETEQTFRAQRLANLGLVTVLEERDLSPTNLVAAMERALDAPRPCVNLDFSGGPKSAAILREALRERRA